MSKPMREIKSKTYLKDFDKLLSVVSDEIKDIRVLEKFLEDLLTDSEMLMIKKRWFVANLISAGRTVREAAEIAGVGTDTVIRVVRKIRKGSGVLKQILLEKNVDTSVKMKKRKDFLSKQKNKSTKWFFGVK